jgi:hypothetical protein
MNEKTFLLYRHQAPQCDYCRNSLQSIEIIKAVSVEEALEKIAATLMDKDWKVKASDESRDYKEYLDEMILNTYLLDPREADNIGAYEHSCFDMILYECVSEKDVLPIFRQKISEVRDFKKLLDQKAQEKNDLEEYEQLKKRIKTLEKKLGK